MDPLMDENTNNSKPFPKKKGLSFLPAWLRNKYVLASLGFILIMFFFDRNDVFTQYRRRGEVKVLEQSKAVLQQKIAVESTELQQIKDNPNSLERYAREKYLMKRDDEDLYIINDSIQKENTPKQ